MIWLIVAAITCATGAVAAFAWAVAGTADRFGPFVLSALLATATIVLVILIPVKAVEKRNCHFAGKQYDRDTNWDFVAGCFIEVNGGRYVKLEQYRAFLEERR